MLQKTITYVDYNDTERTEDFFFNLTDVEIAEINFSVKGGIEKKLQDIIDSNDMKEILNIFKELILLSVGIKSEDGKRFIKNDQIREEFSQSPAYSKLYMELISDDNKAADFINGIIPADKKMSKAELNKGMEEAAERLGVPTPEVKEEPPKVVDIPKPDVQPEEKIETPIE